LIKTQRRNRENAGQPEEIQEMSRIEPQKSRRKDWGNGLGKAIEDWLRKVIGEVPNWEEIED
jgi:hypothetical protein